jgi:hypothetical protein
MMRARCKVVVVLALVASPALASTAAKGPFQLDVPARGFEERCLALSAGERVRYRWAATGEVDFNIHWHRGDAVHYPVKAAAARAADAQFTASHADTYCLMWERKADGTVRIDGAVEALPR